VGESHEHGHATPGDGERRDPAARADFLDHHVARHFEQHVAKEEKAHAQRIDGGCEAQVLVHAQRREADVRAVEEAQQEQQGEKGHEPPRSFGDDGLDWSG